MKWNSIFVSCFGPPLAHSLSLCLNGLKCVLNIEQANNPIQIEYNRHSFKLCCNYRKNAAFHTILVSDRAMLKLFMHAYPVGFHNFCSIQNSNVQIESEKFSCWQYLYLFYKPRLYNYTLQTLNNFG